MSTAGIGAGIRSRRTGRTALTSTPPRTLATIATWWFFGRPSAAVGVSRAASALALVTTGWTGSATVSSGAASTTVIFDGAASAVEVLDRVTKRAARALGGAWSWSIDVAGLVTIATDGAAFELVVSGAVRERLGLTSLYVGASSYVGAAAAAHVLVPSIGLRLDGAEAIYRGGGVAMTAPSTTAFAAPGVARTEDSGSVQVYGTFAELCGLVDDLEGTFDVALGGRWGGRVRTRGIARQPWGIRPDSATLQVDVVGVTR